MRAIWKKHTLQFKTPSGTSRGVLTSKETWFIIVHDDGRTGVGECGMLRGLSIDDRPDFELMLDKVCSEINIGQEKLLHSLHEFPAIQFGLETAFRSINSTNPFIIFENDFSSGNHGIDINGLIWMGTSDQMLKQVKQKIQQGFTCLKLKIGAIDFVDELNILRFIRSHYPPEELEVRVDANGAFRPEEALGKLIQLSEFKLHSIEQPITTRQHDTMSQLCKNSEIPIALDEELIGVNGIQQKIGLLAKIRPQYIILKPSLVGGMAGCDEWIDAASRFEIGWWITSALESNVGLNAIAQYTFEKRNPLPQGLGTGSLYTNNIDSPLEVRNGQLWYEKESRWDESYFRLPADKY